MPARPESSLTVEHRDRLVALGAEPAVLDRLVLSEVTDGLPPWWRPGRNALYLADGVELNRPLIDTMALYPFQDVLLVIATDTRWMRSLLLGGDEATVLIGPESELTAGEIYCGAGSAVVLNGGVVATRCAIVDARNGGSVVAAYDQLWAADVYIATDDMHRLEDLASGQRINAYGGHIRLGGHVWLCRDAVVTGDVEIGEHTVVGLRSLVRNAKVGDHVVVAGTPARVVREGVTWTGDDLP